MSIEAMKQALEALEEINKLSVGDNAICLPAEIDTAIDSLRKAIAEAEKQVSYSGNGTAGRENTTAPTGFFFQMPKSEWVGLTDELEALFTNIDHAISSGAWNVQKGSQTWEIIEHAKAAHGIKEKNT